MVITSLENENVKKWKKLQKRKYRDEYGQYIVEGLHLVREAFARGALVEVILEEHEEVIFPCPYTYVTREIIEKISTLDNPVNIMGLCRKLNRDEVVGNKILILDEIQDPGNLGTIIRSATAFNFDTLILSEDTVDLYNPKCVRSTVGCLWKTPVFQIKEFDELKDIFNHYERVATLPKGGDVENLENYIPSENVLIMFGSEADGLSDELKGFATKNVTIEMSKEVESLNLSVSAAVFMYKIKQIQ